MKEKRWQEGDLPKSHLPCGWKGKDKKKNKQEGVKAAVSWGMIAPESDICNPEKPTGQFKQENNMSEIQGFQYCFA